jgi:type VI secretion system secreted protein Hcp
MRRPHHLVPALGIVAMLAVAAVFVALPGASPSATPGPALQDKGKARDTDGDAAVASALDAACCDGINGDDSMPGFEAFLRLDGIRGDSLDGRHIGFMDVKSYRWRLTNPMDLGGGGPQPNNPRFHPMRIVKPLDSATPVLFETAAEGDLLDYGVLVVRKVVDGEPVLIKYNMTNVKVVFVRHIGDTRAMVQYNNPYGLPFEEVDLVFQKMTMTFQRLDEAGVPVGPPVVRSFDLATGSA